ncbi:MAG: PEGA domain-containing protein [Spirochaetes bacterium]|nr:PEGA domain-containing protein [Spirochaetota bacterium]
MKRMFICLALCSLPALVFGADKKTRAGVLDFTPKGVSAIEASAVSDLFRNELVASGKFDVLDRNNMDSVLKEQAFQQTGCTETACAVQIGKVLNMEYMLYGIVLKMGSSFYVTVEMIKVETGKIEKSARQSVKSYDDMEGAVKKLVADIAGSQQKKETESYTAKGNGVLSIKSASPADVKVLINGREAGLTPFMQEMAKGEYKVKLVRDGYLPKDFTTAVEEGQTKEINISLMKGIGIEEAEEKRNGAFMLGMVSGGSALACLAVFAGAWKIGDFEVANARTDKTAYTAAKDALAAQQLYTQQIDAHLSLANSMYLTSDIALGTAILALGWSAWMWFDYFNYSGMYEQRKKALSIIPVLAPDRLALQFRYSF